MFKTIVVALGGTALVLAGPLPVPALDPMTISWTGPVLAFDSRGDGRIVQSVGDIQTADRIAILVPGVDTTLANFATGLGGVQRRAPLWQAQQLAAQLDDPRTAVVAWLGYDPPEGIGLAAARSERAVAGAQELMRFVAALAAQRPAARITLIGHSYGSLVVADAARNLPAAVTDLVMLGSPGLDVGAVEDLGTAARVWVGRTGNDWTRRLPHVRLGSLGHGTDPSSAAFGARTLDVSDADGHDGYFVVGTRSLASIAGVVAQAGSVVPA